MDKTPVVRLVPGMMFFESESILPEAASAATATARSNNTRAFATSFMPTKNSA